VTFRDNYFGKGRSFAEWQLEKKLEVGIQTNEAELRALRQHALNKLDQIDSRQIAATERVRGEIEYQAGLIRDAIDNVNENVRQSSREIVGAIQEMCGYLGEGLLSIRWAVERHTEVSARIFDAIVNRFPKESDYYLEQGLHSYRVGQWDKAKDCFRISLEKAPTNFFAYQYLGFVAVQQNDPDEAIANFKLARDYADEHPYHRGLALIHLARAAYAQRDTPEARKLALQATEIDDKPALFWFELAKYSAMINDADGTVIALREAIERNWNHYIWAASENFDRVLLKISFVLSL
jgi:tetratricopeptide (TPR) repeat protein